MATHLRAIDKEFEEADDTGVLVLSGRNLRQFPTVPGELLDFADVFEAGWCSPPLPPLSLMFASHHMFTLQSLSFITYALPSIQCMLYHEIEHVVSLIQLVSGEVVECQSYMCV